MNPRIETFEEFWPHYVHAHRNPVNRALHYAGLTAAIATAGVGAVTLNPILLLAAPVLGYGPSWVGHFFFEGNVPATFGNPIRSLRGDFKMYGLALRGKMAEEVERICGAREADHVHDGAHSASNGTATATA